jgi:hypothetical protein
MLTHRNLVANALQTTAWDLAIRPGHDVNLAVLPLFHVFGLTFCLTCTILMARSCPGCSGRRTRCPDPVKPAAGLSPPCRDGAARP